MVCSDFLTRKECAEIARVSLKTIDRYIKRGWLKRHQFSRRCIRIRRDEFQVFLDTKIVRE